MYEEISLHLTSHNIYFQLSFLLKEKKKKKERERKKETLAEACNVSISKPKKEEITTGGQYNQNPIEEVWWRPS